MYFSIKVCRAAPEEADNRDTFAVHLIPTQPGLLESSFLESSHQNSLEGWRLGERHEENDFFVILLVISIFSFCIQYKVCSLEYCGVNSRHLRLTDLLIYRLLMMSSWKYCFNRLLIPCCILCHFRGFADALLVTSVWTHCYDITY